MLTADQILSCASAAHEVNRVWCIACGDHTQPHWDATPQWQRESAVAGVAGVLAGNTPEQQHDAWCRDKVAAGWVYGQTKDPEAKTHPCLVPYDQLPQGQRVKDHLFVQTVRNMAEGFRLLQEGHG